MIILLVSSYPGTTGQSSLALKTCHETNWSFAPDNINSLYEDNWDNSVHLNQWSRCRRIMFPMKGRLLRSTFPREHKISIQIIWRQYFKNPKCSGHLVWMHHSNSRKYIYWIGITIVDVNFGGGGMAKLTGVDRGGEGGQNGQKMVDVNCERSLNNVLMQIAISKIVL